MQTVINNEKKVRTILSEIQEEDARDMDPLSNAILTILNAMHDAGDDGAFYSYGWNTIGIDVTKNRVSVVDIEEGKELIRFGLDVNQNKSIRRWVYIINILRALPYTNLNNELIEIDEKTLRIRYSSFDDNGDIFVIDEYNDETVIIFSENGSPAYCNKWAREFVQCYQYNYLI